MPDEKKPPTIPEIVRALITINDRHTDALRAQKARHDEEMKTLKGRFTSVDEALLSRDLMVEELERVIATLCSRIDRTQKQLKHDNQQCVYSEPLELINLLGTTYDASVLFRQAREKAHDAKRLELARQKAEQTAADQNSPATTACQCGRQWADEIPNGHNLSRCFVPCRVCGHEEDRHVEMLPEEGGNNYCQDCSGTSPFPAGDHTFNGAVSAHWDYCQCGHSRREHRTSGLGGASCKVCVQGHGKQHDFALK